MDLVLPLLGTVVLLVVGQDVFTTVLFPASGRGIVRKPLARLTSAAFALVARRFQGRRRRGVMAFLGPVQIAVSIAAWFVLLVLGWAAIYQPALGNGIRAARGATDTGWANALYYSGFSLTTLGVGDLAPVTDPYRVLTVVEAAIGFSWFTMVITYFLSVYRALMARNSFAQGLHQRTGRTGDAVELLVHAADGPDLPELVGQLSSSAGFLRDIYQTHRFYPVLRYFHYREPYYALPTVLSVTLETCTLLRSALDQERYSRTTGSIHLDELVDSALTLLDELVPDPEPVQLDAELLSDWKDRFHDALKRLADGGLHTTADAQSGFEQYVALRAQWWGPLRHLSDRTMDEQEG